MRYSYIHTYIPTYIYTHIPDTHEVHTHTCIPFSVTGTASSPLSVSAGNPHACQVCELRDCEAASPELQKLRDELVAATIRVSRKRHTEAEFREIDDELKHYEKSGFAFSCQCYRERWSHAMGECDVAVDILC